MNFKHGILVCTFFLVVLTIGSVSAFDEPVGQDNLTASEIPEDFIQETSVNGEEVIQETSQNEIIQKDDDEGFAAINGSDEDLSYDDGSVIVEVYSGPYYLGYSDPVCRIVDYSGVTGYITIMIDGSSQYSDFGSNSGYQTSWEYVNPSWINSFSYGSHEITVYYQAKKIYHDTKTVEFTYFFDCYAMEDDLFTTSVEYGDNINLNLKLPDDVSNNATVQIGGKTYDVSIVNGKGQIYIPTSDLSVGNNTIVATYAGDSKYSARSVNESILIYDDSNKPADKISSKDFNVNINEYVILNSENTDVFNFTCPINAQGKIAMILNDYYSPDQYHDYYIDGVYLNGTETNIPLNVLGIKSSGKYSLVLKYVPYTGCNFTIGSGSFTVTKSNANYTADDFKVVIKDLAYLNDSSNYAFSFYYPKGVDGKITTEINGVYDESHDFYIDANYVDEDINLMPLGLLGIDSIGDYYLVINFVPEIGDDLILSSGKLSVVEKSSSDNFNFEFYDEWNINSKAEPVLDIWKFPSKGTLTVSVDGQDKYVKLIDNTSEDIFLKLYQLEITKNGNYNVSVNFKTEYGEYIGLGNFTLTVDVNDWAEVVDDNIEVYSSLDILGREDEIAGVIDSEGIIGNVSVYIDFDLYFTKQFTSSDNINQLFLTVDDLGIFNNFTLGNHTVKILYMKNNEEVHVSQKTVNFASTYDVNYRKDMSVGENDKITINVLKEAQGNVTVYYGVKSGDEWVKSDEVFEAVNFTDGVAEISLNSLKKGEYRLYLVILTDIYQDEDYIKIDVNENSQEITASVTPSEVTSGSNVHVNLNGPVSDNNVHIYVDGAEYISQKLTSGSVSQDINNLTVGTHSIKVIFSDDSIFFSNTYVVTVKSNSGSNSTSQKTDTSKTTSTNTAKKTKVIKLTLKKVKIKKSAKKLVLKATLKINKKAAKNKKVTFKFNGKKYKVKTNKKGIAKLTIKKKVLKKLKVGKKVKYQVTYSKKTVKRTAKVKK